MLAGDAGLAVRRGEAVLPSGLAELTAGCCRLPCALGDKLEIGESGRCMYKSSGRLLRFGGADGKKKLPDDVGVSRGAATGPIEGEVDGGRSDS